LRFGWRPGTVVMVNPGGPADRAGIGVGDEVDAVNGISTRDRDGIERVDNGVRRGDVVVYRIRREGVVRDVPVRFESVVLSRFVLPMLIASLAVALVFLAIGLFIFWRDPVDRRAVLFFAMCVVATIYLISSGAAA